MNIDDFDSNEEWVAYQQGRDDERAKVVELMDNIWNSTSCREKAFECWFKLKEQLKEQSLTHQN